MNGATLSELAETLKRRHGDGFIVVTPGIRPSGAEPGDQVRTATPADAVRAGSDLLVVGRPMTIDGSTTEGLTISGNGTVRVFRITSGAMVTLRGLTIASGFVDGTSDTSVYGGGGVFVTDAGTVLVLDRCLVRDCQANGVYSDASSIYTGYGGGLLTDNGTTASVVNCTFDGNGAQVGGGAIADYYGSTISVMHTTVTGNTGGYSPHGSGALYLFDGSMTVGQSILSGNTHPDGGENNNFYAESGGVFTSDGFNLADTTIPGAVASDLASRDPATEILLGALQDNGGPTRTRGLAVGSLALDAIFPLSNGCGSTYVVDQRGELRPANGSCDMGAFELQVAPTTTTITSDTPDPSVYSAPVTVSYSVTSPSASPTGDVMVSDGVDSCGGTVAGGSCTLTLSTLGPRTLTAWYAGDGTSAPSVSTGADHTVLQAATTTAVTAHTPSPSAAGQGVTVTYAVAAAAPATAIPTGTVTVSDGVDSCSATAAAGQCGLTITTAGDRTLTASYSGDANFLASSGTVSHHVDPGAATTLVVSGFPSPTTAGTSGGFSVTALDAFGNVATGYTGMVHFTSSDADAALPADALFTAADVGTRAFSATLYTAGAGATLTATDTTASTVTGIQSGIQVDPAAASTFTVTGFPSPVTAGTTGSFSVTALDAYANVATGYLGTVHLTSDDPAATLPPDTAFLAGDAGTRTFSATLVTVGSGRSLTATDTTSPGITGSQTGIQVDSAAAASLVVDDFPSPIVAGTGGTFSVTAMDPHGNVATGYLGTVHFTSDDAAATLPADHVFLASDAGTRSFTATLWTGGAARSLTATDTTVPSITGTQSGIQVNEAPTITSAASTTFVVGSAGSFTASASGYPPPTFSVSGSLPSGLVFDGPTGALSGTPAAGTGGALPLTIAASNGVAPDDTQSFMLTVDEAPSVTSADATTFRVGDAGTFTVTTAGFPTASISQAGTLPTGVSFTDHGDGTATLAGTPEHGQGGVYMLSFTAANGVSPDAVQSFTLTVSNITVYSGPTATGTGIATATVSGGGDACTFLDAAFVDVSTVPVRTMLTFPHGLFDFTLRGCVGPVTLTIGYPRPVPAGAAYWKFGPEPGQADPHWYAFLPPAAVPTSTFTLLLTDGEKGDDDLVVNGDIVDQGGPGLEYQDIPVLGARGLAALIVLLLAAGVVILRRS